MAKLNEAQEVVSKLKAEATEQEVRLAEKQEEANRALQLITNTMKNANDQKVQMENLKEQTLKENQIIAERFEKQDIIWAQKSWYSGRMFIWNSPKYLYFGDKDKL